MRGSGVVAFAAVLSGCASTGSVDEEMSRLRREIHSLRGDLSKTRLEVERLEERVTLLSLGQGSLKEPRPTPVQVQGSKPTGPSLSSKDSGPKGGAVAPAGRALPVVRLAGNAAQSPAEDPSWEDPGAQDDGSPPVMIKLGEAGGDRIAVDHEVLKKADPVLSGKRPEGEAQQATEGGEEREYERALAAFRSEGKAEEALRMFEAFRKAHPSSSLDDNAMYWMGECWFALREYGKAAGVLDALVKRYPRSGKVADAMFRASESYVELAMKSEAMGSLEKILERFPGTAHADRAKARLEALRAEGGR